MALSLQPGDEEAGSAAAERAGGGAPSAVLVVRAGERRCGFALAHVVETMRPLPVEALPGLPRWVQGVARVRGDALPVVDLAALLGETRAEPQRFVTVRVSDRQVALAVDRVEGVLKVPGERLGRLPPLVRELSDDTVAALLVGDEGLVLVLDAARLLPEGAWLGSRSNEATA